MSRQRGKVGGGGGDSCGTTLANIISEFDTSSRGKSRNSAFEQENSPERSNSLKVKQIIQEITMKGEQQGLRSEGEDNFNPSTPKSDRKKKIMPPVVTPTDTINLLSLHERRGSSKSPGKGSNVSLKAGNLFADLNEQEHEQDQDQGPETTTTQRKPGFGGFRPSTLVIDPKTEKVYKIIRKFTGTLGGNGTTGAIYGELTIGSMQKCINILVEKCGMNHTSRFIDVGSGLGKPNFHAAQDPACRLSLGVELEFIRWQLAMHNLYHVLPEMVDDVNLESSVRTPRSSTPRSNSNNSSNSSSSDDVNLCSNTNFMCLDIDAASSMDPFTHIYMYDLGFPPPLQQSIARKFNESVHARYLVSYRPPHRVIHEYGYKVELVDQVPTSMHGSQEMHTAYFYKRTNKPATRKHSDTILRIPGRKGYYEADVEVVCDPAFYEHSRLAVGKVADLREFVTNVASANMESERPRRERKQTIKYSL